MPFAVLSSPRVGPSPVDGPLSTQSACAKRAGPIFGPVLKVIGRNKILFNSVDLFYLVIYRFFFFGTILSHFKIVGKL